MVRACTRVCERAYAHACGGGHPSAPKGSSRSDKPSRRTGPAACGGRAKHATHLLSGCGPRQEPQS
eukprot:8701829-Alexandrium_andersonii.AAC.1